MWGISGKALRYSKGDSAIEELEMINKAVIRGKKVFGIKVICDIKVPKIHKR
jgi:hypothetical protein